MKKSFGISIRRTLKNASNNRRNKRIIQKFTKKVGMLYFGSVDQRSDDHQVIRGFTVSATHKDSHYSVGTFKNYDIALVNRSDILTHPSESPKEYDWLVLSVRLHNQNDLPHMFIKAKQHNDKAYELLFDIFPVMQEIKLGVFEDYGEEFTSRFALYSQPSKAIECEKLLPASTARTLSAHFWPLSIEICDNILYVCSDSQRVDEHLLDNMLKDGLWLAASLDNRSDLI